MLELQYPDGFPEKLQAPVEAAIAQAEGELREVADRISILTERDRVGLTIQYVLRVFLAFSLQACEAWREGLWTGERTRLAVAEFLHRLICVAIFKVGPQHQDDRLRDNIRRVVEESEEWQKHQSARLAVSGELARAADQDRSVQIRETQHTKRSRATAVAELNWDNVVITFVSDERVQIAIGGRIETRNYAEMGFEDKRDGKPNQIWVLLRVFATKGGEIPLVKSKKEFAALEKRVERLRQTLQSHFGISSDPIPLSDYIAPNRNHSWQGKSYKCRFEISCAPSFDR